MDIFCAPRQDGENASEFVRMLLKLAYSSLFGGEMPEISKTPDGKPYFVSRPDICFSLSHTDGFVLCAIGENEVGADIQVIRNIHPRLPERVCAAHELEQFDFFELWALKESVIKLFGKAPAEYRGITFSRRGGNIICSIPGIRARLYGEVPSCAVAACCFNGDLPEHLLIVPPEKLHLTT